MARRVAPALSVGLLLAVATGAPACSSSSSDAPAPEAGQGGSSGEPSSGMDGGGPPRDAMASDPDAAEPGVFGSDPLPPSFTKRLLDTNVYPDARCNDGTASGYYAEAGKAGATTSWIIVLQGGAWCSTAQDCAGRGAALTSSSTWAATIGPNGALSGNATSNPHYAQANRVFVPYCTSDVFSGDRPAVPSVSNFQFRGRKVLAAVISDLRKRHGLGRKGQSVVLGGLSAGAVGALASVDRVHAQIPDASLVGLVDAGFLPDVQPLAGPSIVQQFQSAMAVWNGLPNETCAASTAAAPWKCYLGEYALAAATTRVFVAHNLKDPNGALHTGGFTLGAGGTATAQQTAWYNQTYIPSMSALLGALPPVHGVFAPCRSGVHTMADSVDWTTFMLAGRLYDDDVAAFQAGNAAAPRSVEQPCTF